MDDRTPNNTAAPLDLYETSASSPPAELRALEQWVCYDPPSKVPLDAKVEQNASSTDPTTWASYDVAVATGLGVGFVFTASDPYAGIDLDHVRDPETGALLPWAARIVERLNSYTEVSLSGTGLHIFVRGGVPKAYKGHGIEVYDRARYFTVTGQHLDGTPLTIEARQDVLNRLLAYYFPPPALGTSASAHERGWTDAILRDGSPMGCRHNDAVSLVSRYVWAHLSDVEITVLMEHWLRVSADPSDTEAIASRLRREYQQALQWARNRDAS